MDKFVTKSPVNGDEKSLKRKGNDYDKQVFLTLRTLSPRIVVHLGKEIFKFSR